MCGTKVLFAFEGEDNLNVYDYSRNEIVHSFPCPNKGEKPFVLLSLSEVVRQDMLDEDTDKRKGVIIKAF